jgi:hypothetical protein
MKKPEQIRKVYPKAAIQAAGIEPSVHQGIVTFDHHESLTSQTIHQYIYLQKIPNLLKSFHHQRHATCQQSSADNGGRKREIRAGSTAG